MTKLEKMAMDSCAKEANPFLNHCDNFEYGYLAGFKAAREMIAKYLGPPWPYANLNMTSNEITWDRDAMRLIIKSIRNIAEEQE